MWSKILNQSKSLREQNECEDELKPIAERAIWPNFISYTKKDDKETRIRAEDKERPRSCVILLFCYDIPCWFFFLCVCADVWCDVFSFHLFHFFLWVHRFPANRKRPKKIADQNACASAPHIRRCAMTECKKCGPVRLLVLVTINNNKKHT